MNLEHQCNGGGRSARFTVTAVGHTSHQSVLGALFTNMAIAKKRGRRTQQPVVMQSLQDRNSLLLAHLEDRRRNHHESVVRMDQIRFFLAKNLPDILLTVFGGDDSAHESDLSSE